MVVVAAAAAIGAGGAQARGNECEAVGKVCLGTLPSSHTRVVVNIRRGGCAGKVLRHLGSIVDGKGITRANPMQHLSGYAVVVHETTAAGARVVACGVVPRYVPKRD
jgi:hypothetical protein